MNKLIIAISIFLFIVCVGMGYFLYKEITKPKPEAILPKYELIMTKLDYLDSLLSADNTRITNLVNQSETFKNKYASYLQIKNTPVPIIHDTSELLRNLSEFTEER